jgi:hypothetical protein
VADERLRTLLVIVAVLAALRLVVVPWARAQNDAHDRLVVLTQQFDRSAGVVQNHAAIDRAHRALSAEMSSLRARFPAVADAQQFRLEAQRGIEQVTRASGMQLRMFEWVMDGELPDAALGFGRVKVSLAGTVASAARVQAEIEGALPQVMVRESQLNLRTPSPATPDAMADLTMTADVFYRKAAP